MRPAIATFLVGAFSLLTFDSTQAASEGGDAGILHAKFVYAAELEADPLTKGKCEAPAEQGGLANIGIDVAVALIGKATESLIDAVAAKTQAEATTLLTTVPLDGFYGGKFVAVDHGCFVIHNGRESDAEGATLRALLQVSVSPDSSAFRFTVVDWKFSRFLKPVTSRWGQDPSNRDFAFKIEFLTPGSESLGRRAVFIEHTFVDVSSQSLSRAFEAGQKLPWFAAPAAPSGESGKLRVPLNVQVTVVETTRPKQFAVWLQDIAKNKKADVVGLVQEAVRKTLDPNYAATQDAQTATAAGAAYTAYKNAWDAYAAQVAAKPADVAAGATPAQAAAYAAAIAAWKAGVTVNAQLTDAKKVAARAAFASAGLPWPGDLPAVPS